jgi:spore coat polysaccharide biosynthesis protein SpsF
MQQRSIKALIQARMASNRLPGKVLMKLGNFTVVEQLVRRLETVAEIEEIVVATSTSFADDELVRLLENNGIAVFRGSETDVLGRLALAAQCHEADLYVKVTADCPVLDPIIAQSVIRVAIEEKVDFVSNGIVRSFPDGMDCAVVTRAALLQADAESVEALEREHASLYIRRHPEKFAIKNILAPAALTWPELGLTLDTPEDLVFLDRIFAELGPDKLFSCEEIIDLMERKPELVQMNEGVLRKGDT